MGVAPDPEEGTASNRYTILGRLAGGGMAEIFLARATSDAGVERHVVLKRVLPERSRDPAFATMFLDEARLASQLHHPNIAQVHDIGRIAGSYFFTMEYVHGEDVRGLLQRLSALHRALPTNLALHVAAGALGGLHHAHERCASNGKPLGIVHRDVSPSNIMVGYEGVVKLLDFGVAKAAQRQAESRSGTIKGKISYLSPEQCVGGAIDRRCDIYSLGIVMWELLVGKRLYKRDTDYATMTAIVGEQVPPPSALRPELSQAVDRIVLTAMQKRVDARFPTAAAMLEAIETVAAHERHVMTGTAMARFMRELFGERPEPWAELEARGEHDRPITVTSESLSSGRAIVAPPLATAPTLDAHVFARDAVEERLLSAPQVAQRAPGSEDDVEAIGAVTRPWPPQQIYSESTPFPQPRPPIAQPSAPPPRRRRRALVIGGAALVTFAGIVLAIGLTGSTEDKGAHESAPPPAPRELPQPAAIVAPPEQPAAPTARSVPDAGVEAPAVVDAAPPMVATPVPAPARPPASKPPVKRRDPPPRVTPKPPPVAVPPRDPCESKTYRTEHPLKCP